MKKRGTTQADYCGPAISKRLETSEDSKNSKQEQGHGNSWKMEKIGIIIFREKTMETE